MMKFKAAFSGLKTALSHRAVLVQVILACLAVIGGLIIELDHYEWLAFTVCIGLVILCEIFNTAIERIGDYLNIEEDERVRQIKDLSGAAVLVSAFTALAVCIICVMRRIP